MTHTEAMPDEPDNDIPEPPWRTKNKKSRAALTRDAIISAGMKLLDREGVEGLSMRNVATELGVGAATLYWHVSNKSELIDLIIDRAAGMFPPPPAEPRRWQEQLADAARGMKKELTSHRDLAKLTMGRIPFGPNTIRWLEWSLGLLKDAGMPLNVAAYVGDLLSLYVGAYAMEETSGIASPTGEDLPVESIVSMFTDYLKSLPPERFPNIASSVDAILEESDRFEMGLEIIMRGLASYITNPPEKKDREPDEA